MAKSVGLGSDPLLTLDVVREFMLSKGGKIQNHELVAHFKNYLNDPVRKTANREKIKVFVNTLAVVKLDPSGAKILSLKKKYRDSGNYDGDPNVPSVSASSGPAKPDASNAKGRSKSEVRNSKESTKKSQSCENLLEKNVSYEGSEDYVLITKTETKSKSTDGLDNEGSLKEPFVSPSCSQDFEGSDANVFTPIEEEPVVIANLEEKMEAVNSECIPEAVPAKSENQQDQHDGRAAIQPVTPKSASVSEEPKSGGLSVKDVARNLNKLESENQSQVRPPLAQKSKRETRKPPVNDDSNSSDNCGMSFTQLDSEWLMAAANSDYFAMLKMLQTNPHLAGKRDFITGYAPLHWAAKHGEIKVINLLCQHKADVNIRTRGGYTPLHLAAMQNHEEVVKHLVTVHAADTNIRDYNGKKAKQCMHRSASANMSSLLQPRRTPHGPPPPESPSAVSYDSAIGKAMYLGINAMGGLRMSGGGKENAPLPRPTSNDDYELMPPPRELPPVVRKAKPVTREKDAHSDSEMATPVPEKRLHASDSSPSFETEI